MASTSKEWLMTFITAHCTHCHGAQIGVPGVISRKFSVKEIATKSLLVTRNNSI
jgi:hypothetical protein